MFDPKTNKFPYPEETDKHYIKLKKNRGIVFDSDYPYIDKSFTYKFKRFWFRIFLYSIVLPVVRIRLGLKVEGRKNLKKHKDIIEKGVVSCCNHVHMWDFLGIVSALYPVKPNVLIWADNINGEWGKMMRLIGGIPIPESGAKATMAYLRAVKELLNEGNWLHIYPEGSMWEFYRPIRPFKRGTSFFAVDSGKPVLPMAYTFREPNFIRKYIFRQVATLTLHIGEPILKNDSLPKKEQEADLTKRSHAEVCKLAGIKPEENLYSAEFNKSKRADYYTTEYGVGYKGSW